MSEINEEMRPVKESGSARMSVEKRTIEAMIGIYCADNHKVKACLCAECAELLKYAVMRLDKCPFGEKKPACSKCTVHCYSPSMREMVKVVMKFAGPRMISKHPILAILHGLN